MVNLSECIGCGECVKACTEGAIYIDGNGQLVTEREKCTICGECVNVCYSKARMICGKCYTVEELFKEIMKDKVTFFETSGGVTLSGGEFTLYPEFVCELLEKCRNEHIHTAIETCGYVKWSSLLRIEPYVDLFLYDVKLISPDKHKEWTGIDNSLILENLKKLSGMGSNIIIRVPLIPGVNDDEEEFTRIAEYVKSLGNITDIHIMPFHQLGSSKYKAIGLDYTLTDLTEDNSEKIEKCRIIAQNHGLKVDIGGSDIVSGKKEQKEKKEINYFIYKF